MRHRLPSTELVLALVLMVAIGVGPAVAETSADHQDHIRAVEGSLLPLAVEKGQKGRGVALVERMKQLGIPGLSVAVIDGGEIVWSKGYGVTDLESRAPIDPKTLFLAGSISKPVAATGALVLVDRGELELDADINGYLKSWKVPSSEVAAGKPVTLRGLLTHTAGLTVHGFPGYSRTVERPTVPQILDGEKPANTPAVRVDLEPGTKWRYSGGGYTVMQLAVAETAGTSFEGFLAEAVLEPFEMSDSTFENPLPQELVARAASGHYPGQRRVKGDWHVYPEMAAAGLWTTATDLARFAIGLQQGYAGEPGGVLEQKTVDAMFTKHLGDWGLGPSLSGDGDSRLFGHGGRDEGFDAQLLAAVEGGYGVALMINANDNNGFLQEVVASVARVYEWPDYEASEQREYATLSEQTMKEIAGSYLPEGEETPIRLFVWENKLWLSPSLGARIELFADSSEGASFFLAGRSDELTVERDDAGAITGFSYRLFGEEGFAKREVE